MLTVLGIIFFLSHQPHFVIPLKSKFGIDKILHATAYGVLAFTVLYAIPREILRKSSFPVLSGVIIFCLFYGISDEFHQSFINGRDASVWDVLADAAGAVITVLVWKRKSVVP